MRHIGAHRTPLLLSAPLKIPWVDHLGLPLAPAGCGGLGMYHHPKPSAKYNKQDYNISCRSNNYSDF